MLPGQQHLIAHGNPPVIDVDSRAYYSTVRGVRWTSTTLFKGRGLAALDRWSRALVPADRRDVTFRLLPDALFAFPSADNYWGYYLLDGRAYEPEIEMLLRSVAGLDYTFLDGGANYGYWSVLVGSREFGRKKAVAVEMSPTTLASLRKNQELNGNRFDVIQAAITAEGSGEVQFSETEYHSRRSAAGPIAPTDPALVTVGTVSVDDIAALADEGSGIVVKLDIEGFEPDAIAASSVLREHDDLVLIAEDHYKDRASTTVCTCLDIGLNVVFVDPKGNVKPISSASEATRVKLQPNVGYNFLAYSARATGPLPQSIKAATERGRLA